MCASCWLLKLIPFTRPDLSLEREKERLGGRARTARLRPSRSRAARSAEIRAADPADRAGLAHGGRDGSSPISEARTSELVEKKVAAQDQLRRVDIRAPQDGVRPPAGRSHRGRRDLLPGEQIMLIVPEADALTVELRVQPQDVDQLRIGQTNESFGYPPSISKPRQSSTSVSRSCLCRCQRRHQDPGTRFYTVFG